MFYTVRTMHGRGIYVLLLVWYSVFKMGDASIDCFKCISINGNNRACDDPFHNNFTVNILESPCMGGRKGRDGLFPATFCIKITGTFDDNSDHITLRGCALDSGTLTTDTEIVRMSHCGSFYYENRYVKGCIQSCNDADACNKALRIGQDKWRGLILVAFIIGTMFQQINLYNNI